MAVEDCSTDFSERICRVCRMPMRKPSDQSHEESVIDDPMLTTPTAQLCAAAAKVGVDVIDAPREVAGGTAGVVIIGFDEEGELHGIVAVAEDLDDDLRADAIAFGLAVFVADPERIMAAQGGFIVFSWNRIADTEPGPGHPARHMAFRCGRETRPATFEIVDEANA
jgi:hypothetical protein